MRSLCRRLAATTIAATTFALVASMAVATEPAPPRASDATYDARQNFVACVNGEAGRCSPSRLTDAERKLVENASSQRNYLACANGWSAGCDPLRLTADQKRIVDASAAQRAVAPCGSRWALGCGTSQGDAQSSPASAAGTGTQVSSGPPRYELDTQRFYASGYPAYEPRYSWSPGSWIVPTAIAAAATWPLWTHSYHYDYPRYWDDDWYGYPSWGWGWGWDDDHHHGGGHSGQHGHGDGHHGGKPPTYRPPTSQPPLHPPPTYRPTPISKSPMSSAPRPTQPIKRDWR
ncbi:MAG: hypothetical protein IPK07_24245 [Deltaproteobacteria bacterium]|nr:hypothetical protein [Deltaproteobacteria bacterium]